MSEAEESLLQVLLEGNVLTPELRYQLLHDDYYKSNYDWLLRPLYREVAVIVESWEVLGQFPIRMKKFKLLDEIENGTDVMDKLTPEFLNVMKNTLKWRDKWIKLFSYDIITKHNLRYLLNCRTTTGTIEDILPPRVSVLWKAYLKKHKTSRELTVGARALAKHAHRDSETEFWGGELKGSDKFKNQIANDIFQRILKDIQWCNLHQIVGKNIIFELRNSTGHGIRFIYEDSNSNWTFRGFLEPPMENGHLLRWRH